MKAISLWQPWATLMATGAKRFETRGWGTNYRGAIAIHAAQRQLDHETFELCVFEPFRSALEKAGHIEFTGTTSVVGLPFGRIVAVGELQGVYMMHRNHLVMIKTDGRPDFSMKYEFPREPEITFGDWADGRYAWRIINVKQLPKPIPCRGFQKLWELPAEIKCEIIEQLASENDVQRIMEVLNS